MLDAKKCNTVSGAKDVDDLCFALGTFILNDGWVGSVSNYKNSHNMYCYEYYYYSVVINWNYGTPSDVGQKLKQWEKNGNTYSYFWYSGEYPNINTGTSYDITNCDLATPYNIWYTNSSIEGQSSY